MINQAHAKNYKKGFIQIGAFPREDLIFYLFFPRPLVEEGQGEGTTHFHPHLVPQKWHRGSLQFSFLIQG